MNARKIAIVLAGATAVVLIAMVIAGTVTGATQERHEHFMAPAEYAQALLDHAGGLRVMMALDIAFLILYTAFFMALAAYLRAVNASVLGRWFAYVGLAAMIATAVLDIVEDHHIVAMLESAEHGVVPSADAITWQAAASMTKFSLSYLSLVLFGLAVPRTSKLAWVLVLFLTAGTLASAIVGYAVPPEHQAAVEGGRWIGFLAGFGLAIAWLSREPDAQ